VKMQSYSYESQSDQGAVSEKEPFFSIVTVVYNDADGLKRTTKSVLNQCCEDYEWIIVDGGSTDGTVKIISAIESPSLKSVSEEDSGIYDAMNKGVRMASGTYLVFMNAGDIFSSESVLALVKQNQSIMDGTAVVLYGASTLVLQNGGKKSRQVKNINYVWHGLPATHQATYYKRNFLTEYPYDLAYTICGDYYLSAILFLNGAQATYIEESLTDFMLGGISSQSRMAIIDAYRIQRDILSIGLFRRWVSITIRVVKIIAYQAHKRLWPAQNQLPT
jgi:putative colanic acid biosynthesis glycosyltransferase